MRLVFLFVFCFAATLINARRDTPEHVIDLDLPPSQRMGFLINFNSSVWAFYNKFFANDKILSDALYALSDKRGPEPEEYQQEIQAMVDLSRLPLKFVQAIQMLYEIQTLMVPIVNFNKKQPNETKYKLPKEYQVFEPLLHLPWRGPGCTGIIAKCADDKVYHARNLDFQPLAYMEKLVYTGIFKKGGKELFRSQMIAGYSCIITAYRSSKTNGYTIERNTRYPDHWGGNTAMFKNLLGGRPLNGWSLRKIIETTPDYDTAIQKVAAVPFVSTEYSIMSGVKKGTIISKDPDTVAYTQTLGKVGGNIYERDDYIIMTNFDFFHKDIREWFDPTGGNGMFHPRRLAAQKMLNSTTEGELTPEFLFSVINSKGVFADTIFQAIIGVEAGLWNVSIPN